MEDRACNREKIAILLVLGITLETYHIIIIHWKQHERVSIHLISAQHHSTVYLFQTNTSKEIAIENPNSN